MRDIYNYNKIGIWLGIEKKEKVIIKAIRGRIKLGIIINRKSCTLGEYILVDGNV